MAILVTLHTHKLAADSAHGCGKLEKFLIFRIHMRNPQLFADSVNDPLGPDSALGCCVPAFIQFSFLQEMQHPTAESALTAASVNEPLERYLGVTWML